MLINYFDNLAAKVGFVKHFKDEKEEAALEYESDIEKHHIEQN